MRNAAAHNVIRRPFTSAVPPMTRFDCPNCGKKLKLPDEYAGKPAKCPKCGIAIAPEVADDVPFTMPDPTHIVAPQPVYEPQFDMTREPEVIRHVRKGPPRTHRSGCQPVIAVGVVMLAFLAVAFVVLWVDAESTVQRVEQLRYECHKLEMIYDRTCVVHGANSPESDRVYAEIVENKRQQHQLTSTPNILVRWKLRDIR